MKKAQPRQTLNGHSIFSSENAQDAYYTAGGFFGGEDPIPPASVKFSNLDFYRKLQAPQLSNNAAVFNSKLLDVNNLTRVNNPKISVDDVNMTANINGSQGKLVNTIDCGDGLCLGETESGQLLPYNNYATNLNSHNKEVRQLAKDNQEILDNYIKYKMPIYTTNHNRYIAGMSFPTEEELRQSGLNNVNTRKAILEGQSEYNKKIHPAETQFKEGGYMAPILPMHFNKGTQIFRDTTSLPFVDGGPLVDRTVDGKIKDSIYASTLENYYPDGGQLYTYKGRPGATYQKINNKWHIQTEHTNGFIPIKDPTGKRTALLNAQATPMATTTNKYQRTYDPLLDNKPQGGETTQQVAQNYMMAKNSEQYAKQVAKGEMRAQAEKSPEQIANGTTNTFIKNNLTAKEKELAKEYFNSPESNYYYDPTRGDGVLKSNAGKAQSFMERMDELVWPAFQPFTGNPSFEQTKLQEFEKNKVKKYESLNDAMRAVYAEKIAANRGQGFINFTPSEEVQRNQAMQQYQTPPGQMASGRAAPVDWVWTLPIAGPAALEMLGGAGAMSLPGMSAIPGATVGNLVNSGFIANSLMQAPSNAKSWYDVSQGKKNWQDAALESGEIAAGMIGSGAGLKSLAQDAKQVGKYLTTETALKNTYKLNPKALKEAQETMLVRARPVGQDPYMNMASQLRAKEAAGEQLKWYQKNLLTPQTNPNILAREKYYGQWFADNPSDLDFYINPGTRNFADDAQIELLKARMPKSEAAKYSVKNFEDAKKLSNLHDSEYILPKDMVQSLEKFPLENLDKLQAEYKQINTPHWLKGYKPVQKLNTNENILQNLNTVRHEILGALINRTHNKKAIEEGNQWLKNWIEHPATQDKIDTDFFPYSFRNNQLKDVYDIGFEQAKNFIPNSKQYPLKNQLLDFVKGKEQVHAGNTGVSYRHGENPIERMNIPQNANHLVDNSWISRTPRMSPTQRTSTTIHEGTHDWTTDFLLNASGQKENILNVMPLEHQKLYKEWEKLRNEGKSTEETMGAKNSYKAYLSNPTEIHARIMELRKHFNHTPKTKTSYKDAENIIETVNKMPRSERPIDSNFFKVIENDPSKLAYLLNRLWAATPVVGTATGATLLANPWQQTKQD